MDTDKALNNYQLAAKYYSDTEVARGWRADTFRMTGYVYLEKAKSAKNQQEQKTLLATAEDYLGRARSEYAQAVPESSNDNTRSIREVDARIEKIHKGIWNQ